MNEQTKPINTLREYAQDTGAFRVTKEGATKLAEACASIEELIRVANRAATAAVRHEGSGSYIRSADLDDLRAALANVGGA